MPRVFSATFYSPLGGVWRTTMALLAATALAERGHRVLVAEADIETPSLHAYLGPEVRRDIYAAGHYRYKPLAARRYYTLYDAYIYGRAPPMPGKELPRAPWSRDVYLLMGAPTPGDISHLLRDASSDTAAMVRLGRRLHETVARAAESVKADIVLLDTGPGLDPMTQGLLALSRRLVLLTRVDQVSLRRFGAALQVMARAAVLRPHPLEEVRAIVERLAREEAQRRQEGREGAASQRLASLIREIERGFRGWPRWGQSIYVVYTHLPVGVARPRGPGSPWPPRDPDWLDGVHEELRLLLGSKPAETHTRVPMLEQLLRLGRHGSHVELVLERRGEYPFSLVWRAAEELADALEAWHRLHRRLSLYEPGRAA